MSALEKSRAWAGYAWLRTVMLSTEARATRLKVAAGQQPHEAEDRCAEVHCYGHDCDEPGPAWLVCGECFHRYGSARELRKLYRRKAWQAHRRWGREPVVALPEPFTIPDLKAEGGWLVALPPGLDLEWNKGPSTLKVLWRLATIRASKIYFCQVCLHDW